MCEFLGGNGKLWLVVVIPILNKQKEALRRLHEILNLESTVHDRTPWALVWFTTKKVREIDKVVSWSRIMVVLWYLMLHSLWGKVSIFESTSIESYESSHKGPGTSPCVYDLIAVCSHHGSIMVGYSTSWTESELNRKWCSLDNSKVSLDNQGQIVMKAVYMLLLPRSRWWLLFFLFFF